MRDTEDLGPGVKNVNGELDGGQARLKKFLSEQGGKVMENDGRDNPLPPAALEANVENHYPGKLDVSLTHPASLPNKQPDAMAFPDKSEQGMHPHYVIPAGDMHKELKDG